MNPADVDYEAKWEAANNFRMDQLFNMGGTVNNATQPDPLLQEFQKTCTSASGCGPGNSEAGKSCADSFGWISHTYDTPNLDVGYATQNYVESQLNENTNVAHTLLGLTETTVPTASPLGAEVPNVFVPGNHSGFANLVPGSPATVDPPAIDSADTVPATGGTLAAGYYEYAVTDQFTNSSTAGQSAADVIGPYTTTARRRRSSSTGRRSATRPSRSAVPK
jgi:hypothetical protein